MLLLSQIFLSILVVGAIASKQSAETTTNIDESTDVTEVPILKATVKAVQKTSDVTKPRVVKNGQPILGDSIKMVANQLLESTTLSTSTPLVSNIVEDTRVPPKLKNSYKNKNKIQTPKQDDEVIENSHAGVAVPISVEEIEPTKQSKSNTKETTTTTHDGISTWILLSNPSTVTTTELEKPTTKQPELHEVSIEVKKPLRNKPLKVNNNINKTKKPQTGNKISKRPLIVAPNKSDLIAGGSAMNENVFNKIKQTVLENVKKHALVNKSTQVTTTTEKVVVTSPATLITKKDFITKLPKVTTPVSVVTEKPKSKKKNKNKVKVVAVSTTTEMESAMLPMEPKEEEIEIEVSTPAATTKKPKRTSHKKKKNKTRKRKPSKKTKTDLKTSDTKLSNSTKLSKIPGLDKPITTQIYNYLSREVMPSVGVGIVGLAGLVGLASYFLYPFAGPVRRAYTVDKKDDLYHNNAEEYANEGNGQAEEEMLGTVLAGMPSKSKTRLNPYSAQTPNKHSNNEYDPSLRYRHSGIKYEPTEYNTKHSQQKTGIAHDAAHSNPLSYNVPDNDRNSYDIVEPMYPQITPSRPLSYNGESINTVYGMPNQQETSFEPAYPFESHVFSETTVKPYSHPSTSLYLGSDKETQNDNSEITMNETIDDESDPQFVVGSLPKEFTGPVTPATVPEHGPRNLNRRRRGIPLTIDEIIKQSKNKDNELSNEVDESLSSEADTTTEKAAEFVKQPTYELNALLSLIDKSKLNLTSTKATVVENISTQPLDTTFSSKTETKVTESGDDESPALSTLTADTPEGNDDKTTTEEASNVPDDSKSTTETPLSIATGTTDSPLMSFFKRLIEFKLKLGMSILQTTSDHLTRYLKGINKTEEVIKSNDFFYKL